MMLFNSPPALTTKITSFHVLSAPPIAGIGALRGKGIFAEGPNTDVSLGSARRCGIGKGLLRS